MSEPKLISPMLDNFVMGDPISEHNGVRCCPAIENETDNKYIVKIISTPASQAQLDALLLSGAYASVEAADDYFKSLAEGVVEEAKVLEKLSQLEGFFPYTNVQLTSMDEETGYDVYLLSPYRKTLAQLLRRDSMTHLSALNLALDVCAALTICRRSGYLYVDLKPENIYLDSGKSSKIGDIGFISLNSLRFASLPERYRSAYTAPEISDAFASLNTTVDVYALGLILYQIFNDGLLPSVNHDDSNIAIAPPAYADYEMAEIILKACDPNPENRWQDPVEMGQAIVSYMQRNGVHDTPIVPVPPAEPAPVILEEQADIADKDKATEEAVEDDVPTVISAEESTAEDSSDDSTESGNNTADDLPEENISDQEDVYAEDNDEDLVLITEEYDETLPEQDDAEIDYTEISNEVSDILYHADELISHPALDPVIPPEPIDVPIPPPIASLDDEESDEESDVETATEEIQEPEDLDDVTSDQTDDTLESEAEATPQKKRHWLRNILVTITVLAIATVGILFYTRYYLQPIDSIVLQEHENGDLTVLISSPVDESKLSVICSDTYGNQLTQPVVNGQASFTGLSPDSAYTVKIAINGFHRLTGDTSGAFTTPAQTNIVQFSAVTGSEDGSVILTFTIDGPDSSQWKVRYSSTDTEEQAVTFSGRMHTITGLTVGNEYKFVLTPETNLNFIGTNEVTHIASTIVKADKLRITGSLNGTLTAAWSAPRDNTVESWTVRCYNDSGYDKTVVVTETSVSFDGVDNTSAYTVEVTAAGMSVSERAYAAANSVTVTDFNADTSNANKIVLNWNSNGYTPEKGWLLMYTVDGSAAQEISNISGDTAELTTKVPGANYAFSLQTVDGTSILGGQLDLQTPEAKSFSSYGVSAKYMEFKMCKRPSQKNWDRYDLSSSDYTSTFKVGQKASFLVRLKREYNTSKDNITTLYVIRDENGSVVSTSSTTTTWTKMWYRNYCELNIPSIPQTAGKYTISVYFNGALAHSQSFNITA